MLWAEESIFSFFPAAVQISVFTTGKFAGFGDKTCHPAFARRKTAWTAFYHMTQVLWNTDAAFGIAFVFSINAEAVVAHNLANGAEQPLVVLCVPSSAAIPFIFAAARTVRTSETELTFRRVT